ncbi:hypothetical protein MNBD_DELTA01-1642 [hydrothermal vent metagenome]|uniref:Uncharacterized protein n=1 Tax=hydrothermal vent metagenome TaxID=652676 RepID=A0A3B0QQM5_9ZZZZ
MKYSTERKKRSRLLGHRKRRRIPDGEPCSSGAVKIDWTEYKAMRQYQSLGEVLDGVRAYGFDGVKELDVTMEVIGSNGHRWITEDQEV